MKKPEIHSANPKKLFMLLLSVICVVPFAGTAQLHQHLSSFKYEDVQLLPGVFKAAEQTDLKYILALDKDKLLAPFLRESGLPAKAQSYTNWENSGLDGHIGGHYLSALAMMYAATGNKETQQRLTYMLNELKRCQDKNGDGYIGGVPGSKPLWAAVMQGDIDALQKKWVPFYNIHKVYAGLRDAYMYAGNEQAKKMLIKFSDWFVKLSNALTPQKMQQMLRTEHGGVNEVLADVYALTGDKKYLDAAYSFSHKAILEPLENRQDKLNNLHANTQIPKIIGFKRIADVNEDSSYNKAARFFWETVVTKRTVAIGGNSVREHFNPSDDFSSMITTEQGPETCNTYNMLKLTKMLYESDALVKYIDYYERALYNHILSTQEPEKGGFVYFTPMRPGHYRIYSQPQTSMWCCVGSGMENHAKYNELIYAHDENSLYVNLFIPSRLNWKEKGLSLTQQTNFPEEEKTTLTINAVKPAAFAINFRYPSWVAKGALKVKINGKAISVSASPASYITINRLWKKGDRIEVYLPMRTTTEQLPDGLNYVSVLHGPIVLGAKTDTTNMSGLFADNSRMGHVANGKQYPLQDMPLFVSSDSNTAAHITPVQGKVLTFKAAGILHPAKYKSLELVPFYKIHNSRYVIYWQKVTPEGLASIRQKMAVEEAERSKLEALTIDVVKAGEQQPESDHFIESEKSNTGVNKDRHWRDAKGWFSYKMTDKEMQAGILLVTYYGKDNDRRFKIIVNDETIADVILDGSHGDTFFTEVYTIPENIVKKANGQVIVKFLAAPDSRAGGVYEVRLLKK
ncbi:MAG: glycoside hydrolase family 127 protein [Ferruginibacter sp.]